MIIKPFIVNYIYNIEYTHFIVKKMQSTWSNDKYSKIHSKILDYELLSQSRQSTREQIYQQLQRHKAQLRKDNHQIRKLIQQKKQEILASTLKNYAQKLKQLNEINQNLREKHRLIYQTKKPTLTTQTVFQRSPLKTPKSRKNFTQLFNNNDNSFSKVSLQSEKPINFVSRKSLNNQNNQNMKPRTYGRMSLKISEMPRRNEQLTQRKMVNSVCFGVVENGCNVSTFSQTHSMRSSLKSRAVDIKSSNNIFFQMINVMLQEQRERQKQFVQFVSEQNFYHRGHDENYINNLQLQVKKTSKNIQKMQKVLQNYEQQMKKMKINLSSVHQMARQLGKTKMNYISMQQRCKNIQYLKIEIGVKQNKLKQLKQTNKAQIFQPPSSIQMILRLLGVDQKSLNDPSKCKQNIKNFVKGTFEKPSKKKIKVKQLLDSIREGRKKFRQLMSVYQGRIKKLQKKLISFRGQQV